MDQCYECGKEFEPIDAVLDNETMVEKSEGKSIHYTMKWKIYCKDCAKKTRH